MQTWIIWLVIALVIIMGVWITLGPGMAIFIVALTTPYIVATFIAREMRVRAAKQTVDQYLRSKERS